MTTTATEQTAAQLTLLPLLERARERAAAALDTECDLREWSPRVNSGEQPAWMMQANGLSQAEAGTALWDMQPTAQKQLCKRIGAPHDYLYAGKLPGGVVEQCITAGLSELDKGDALLRLNADSEQMRAILRAGYQPIDDEQGLAALYDVLADYPDARVEWTDATETLTRVSVTVKDCDLGDSDGSIGFCYSNSEVHERSPRIQGAIGRYVCSNGMLIGTQFSDLRFSGLAAADWRAEMAAAVRDAIAAAEQAAEVYCKSVSIYAAADVDLAKLAAPVGITFQLLMDAWQAEPNNTVAGVVNAITLAAKGKPQDKRMHAEAAAVSYMLAAVEAYEQRTQAAEPEGAEDEQS